MIIMIADANHETASRSCHYAEIVYSPIQISPGTIMTMDGTVRDILGYPLFSLINEARSPAVRAPANAAAGAGIPVRSTSQAAVNLLWHR